MNILIKIANLIWLPFKYLSLAIYICFKYLFKGIFLFFDTFFTILFSIFMYLYIGLYNVIKFVYFIFTKIYKFALEPIVKELIYDLKSFYLGLTITLKSLFYTIPKRIIMSLSSFFNKVYISSKKTGDFFKKSPSAVKDYFINKFENLSVVKHYRNKKERELEVLYIDKNSKDAERSEVKHAYQYVARNSDGKLVRGHFSALSKLDTHSYLIDEGYEVYSIKTSWWMDFIYGETAYNRPINQKYLIFWLTQVSTYVKSGVPLTDTIKILAKQNKQKRYRRMFDSVIYELTMGESFSESLRKQGKTFPPLLINMLKAAEMIGDIEGTLDEMADYYSEIQDTKKMVVSALFYPAIILVFSIAVLIFMLTFVIPKFVALYTDSGMTLPAITVLIMNVSHVLVTQYRTIILFVIGIAIILYLLYKNIKAFRIIVQYIEMHIPVLGTIIIYKEMTIFAKTFSSLNKNNILLTDSMEILSKITRNEIYKMIMFDTVSNLLRGDKMSTSFKDHWAIPDIAYHMITTGESTGELSVMLEKVSEYFQKEQRNKVKLITTIIEPIMIMLLAVIVGVIIVAVLLPIVGMWNAI